MAQDKEMFFFIADISGYTAYMLTNSMECEHAKHSLTLLIETLVEKIHLPLEISKLEGDAIFLYLQQPVNDQLWLTKKIFTFFDIFEKKIRQLKLAQVCSCGACRNIESLQLKVIAHYGKASLQTIGRFKELSGVDVIILHRLLKNHVPSHRYLLLTETAYRHMLIPENVKVSKMQENYEDIGTLPIYVCDPPHVPEIDLPVRVSILFKIKHWLQLHFGQKQQANYRNIPKK